MAAPRRNVVPRRLAALAVAPAVVAAPAGAPVAGFGPLAAWASGGSDEHEAGKAEDEDEDKERDEDEHDEERAEAAAEAEKAAAERATDEGRGDGDGGGTEGRVAPTAAYRVAVDCAYDAAGDRTTCAVAGGAAGGPGVGGQEEDGEGAEDVGFVVVPEDGVCADVLGGDHEHVDPDPNAQVAGYKSRGNGGALTLVLAGEVGTGGEAIYWLKAGDKVHPATGPGLRCGRALVVAGPFPVLAAILLEAAACPPGTRAAAADWHEDCREPAAGARFALARWDGARFVPAGAGATDATGRLRFERLEPGTYRLREEGAAWCHAESDSVDGAGDVGVRAGQEAHVWVFHCAEPGTPTPPAK